MPSLRSAAATVILRDRILLLGTAPDAYTLAADIDQALGGVVAVGAEARFTIRQLRASYPDMVLIEQPNTHEKYLASRDCPFPYSHDDDPEQTLFHMERSLKQYLDDQLTNGASVAMLPTGYIAAGDHACMSSVVKMANLHSRSDVVLHLPVSHRWLSASADRKKLVAAIQRSRHPVALSMAHKSDPASQAGVVAGVHDLLTQAPGKVALWHADLGALDALVNGGLGAAVGVSSSHRHIVAPDEVAFSPSRGADRTPNVLLHEHLRYKKSQAMTRDWFANGAEPACDCGICRGRYLNRFNSAQESKTEAHRHNLQRISMLHRQLLEAPYRDLWWAQLLTEAEVAHERTAVATGVMTIKPEGALKQWISLNPIPGSLMA